MSTIDISYDNAIRCYLDRLIFNENEENNTRKTTEPNVAKAFARYIKSLTSEDFKFSYPMFVWWDLTSACNFRCVHCLYNDTEYSARYDLSPDENLRLAEELVDTLGVVEVILSGGEIFLRPELIDIIKILKSNNVAVKLLTNASLITEEQIDLLGELLSPYCDSMQISLDGATPETYRKIRQNDGFYKIINNISKLVENNVKVAIAGTVNKINYTEIPDLYRLCDNLGVDSFYPGKMLCFNQSHRDIAVNYKDLLLMSEKLIDLEKSCTTKLCLAFFSPFELLNEPDVQAVLHESNYQSNILKYKRILERGCNSHDRMSIKPNGDVFMCPFAATFKELSLGNVKNFSLEELWERRKNNVFYQYRDIKEMKCQSCKYNVICSGGCMVKAYKNFGTINAPEDECAFSK